MIALLAALSATAQLTPAKPVEPWIREEDYIQTIVAGDESASLIRVIVSPAGKPETCKVEWSTGNARMDRLSCALTLRRSKFTAARDDAGKPAWGEFQEVVNFYQSDGRPSSFPMQKKADLELIVKDLPAEAREATVKVAVEVDPQGALEACTGEADTEEQLASIACRQLTANWVAAPAVNAAGKAVPYVASRKVSFRAE